MCQMSGRRFCEERRLSICQEVKDVRKSGDHELPSKYDARLARQLWPSSAGASRFFRELKTPTGAILVLHPLLTLG